MNVSAAGADWSSWWEVAQRIRVVAPVRGELMTNAEAIARNVAVTAALDAAGVGQSVSDSRGAQIVGRHVWHTVLMVDGLVCGQWADNPVEAALESMVSRGVQAAEVQEDPDLQWRDYLLALARQRAAQPPSAQTLFEVPFERGSGMSI